MFELEVFPLLLLSPCVCIFIHSLGPVWFVANIWTTNSSVSIKNGVKNLYPQVHFIANKSLFNLLVRIKHGLSFYSSTQYSRIYHCWIGLDRSVSFNRGLSIHWLIASTSSYLVSDYRVPRGRSQTTVQYKNHQRCLPGTRRYHFWTSMTVNALVMGLLQFREVKLTSDEQNLATTGKYHHDQEKRKHVLMHMEWFSILGTNCKSFCPSHPFLK
jgi:hypothetical protein